MRALVFTGAGGPEVMRLEERPDPVPGTGEVLVEQRFGGLNPADLLQRAGHYPAPPGWPPDIPGLDVAGRVVSVGDKVTGLSPGDRVFGLAGGGGLADRVCVPARHVAAVPDALDDEQAAAAPEAFITAHDAVVSVQCGLSAGETLLINGASGGVGTAAVQLGVACGAHVIATVRNDAAREWLRAAGAEPVGLAEARGRADVVLELVGAPNMDANLDAAALRGRIVVVGTAAGFGQADRLGTGRAQPLAGGVVADGGDHVRAASDAQLHGCGAHAAAGPVDQQRLAGAEAALHDHGVVRRDERLRRRGRLLVVQRVGNRGHVSRRHADAVGQAAASGQAEDAIAGREAGHLVAHRDDAAGNVETGDVRRPAGRCRVVPGALQQVGRVEPAEPLLHQHLAGTGDGVGPLLESHHLGAARSGEHQGSHGRPR